MGYTAEISRVRPTCFLFLIDQSTSMSDPIPPSNERPPRSKADFLADAINSLLQALVLRCAREEGIRGYFDVGVIGYGNVVEPALSGTLAGRELVSITDIGIHPTRVDERSKRVEDGTGGLVNQTIRKPVWIDPRASGGTSMCKAFRTTIQILERWIDQHNDSFPPTVIHITDGESTDGDPTSAMRDLTALATADGEVLLYNIHVSAEAGADEVVFPDSTATLRDRYATLLFETASPLIEAVRRQAAEEGIAVSDGARGFILNAQPITIIQALEIGTKPSPLR